MLGLLVILCIYLFRDAKKENAKLREEILENAEDLTSRIKILWLLTSDSEGSNPSEIQFAKTSDRKIYMFPYYENSLSFSSPYLLNSFSKNDDFQEFEVIEFTYNQCGTKLKLDNYGVIPLFETYGLDMSKNEFDKVEKWLKK